MSASTTQFLFPILQLTGLKGSLLYFDGQMNDARMCLALALSATVEGFVDGMQQAASANYVAASSFIKNSEGKIIGVNAIDKESGEEFPIYSKVVVNCAGPLSDKVRELSDPTATHLVQPAAGTHIVLPHWYSHFTPFGLLLPKTSDGRILFLLPWEGKTIAGTTDVPANVNEIPRSKKEDIDFLVEHVAGYLEIDAQQIRSDIQSVWCGLRPLVSRAPSKNGGTSNIVRSHVVILDEASGLVSLLGGKWTTYRKMAEDTVDFVLDIHGDKVAASGRCRTKGMKLIGAVDPLALLEPTDCRFENGRLASEVAAHFPTLSFSQKEHLVGSYGFLTRDLLELGKAEDLLHPLIDDAPYLKAEVVFACRYEQCRNISDFLARRIPLHFLDQQKAAGAINEVGALMAAELGWNKKTVERKMEEARKFSELFTVAPH